MKLSDLPDIEFVSADEQEILSDIIKLYTEITGRTLAQGDPVRLFLCVIAAIILMLCNKINYTGKQNLLRYSAGANLDHLGVLVGAERIGAKASVTTIKITLSECGPLRQTFQQVRGRQLEIMCFLLLIRMQRS